MQMEKDQLPRDLGGISPIIEGFLSVGIRFNLKVNPMTAGI